ncbi:MAG: hypothetical protein LBL94_02325, partial [Prevotellaceae bacterium]|nr:hypothetical protein [Prevotellaceae bacterium]
VRDTVTIVAIQQREVVRYVKDSAYTDSIREQYARHQYEYHSLRNQQLFYSELQMKYNAKPSST